MSLVDSFVSRYIARQLLRAPNRGRPTVQGELPLRPLFDRALRVEVGPPRAQIACWIIEPRALDVDVLPEGAPIPDTDTMIDRYLAPRLNGGTRRQVVIREVPGESPAYRGTLLMVHGWRDSVLDRPYLQGLAALLASRGYRVVLPDLRGHGQSSGSYITYGLLERWDILRLIDYLQAVDLAGERVGLFGHSYGGNVVLMAAAQDDRIAAVTAASAPHSLRGVLPASVRKYRPRLAWLVSDNALDQALVRAHKLSGLDFFESNAVSALRHIDAPVLLVHGERDTTVPFESAQQLERARPSGVETLFWPEEGHATFFSDRVGELGDKVGVFFEAVLA